MKRDFGSELQDEYFLLKPRNRSLTFLFAYFVFKTRFLCVALAVLGLFCSSMEWTGLELVEICLPLPLPLELWD